MEEKSNDVLHFFFYRGLFFHLDHDVKLGVNEAPGWTLEATIHLIPTKTPNIRYREEDDMI